MSEYEPSLLRQRGLEAGDAEAKRGGLRFSLPPGHCWDELGRLETDPDERIAETIRLVLLRKFREFDSARQAPRGQRIERKKPAYFTALERLRHPIYAGTYVLGRSGQRTCVTDGRARKTSGHAKAMPAWSVSIRDHNPGYSSWTEFGENQQLIAENAHMRNRMSRKCARGRRRRALARRWLRGRMHGLRRNAHHR